MKEYQLTLTITVNYTDFDTDVEKNLQEAIESFLYSPNENGSGEATNTGEYQWESKF